MRFAKNNPFGIRGSNRQANTRAKPPNGKSNDFSLHSFREWGCPGGSQTACGGMSPLFLVELSEPSIRKDVDVRY